MSQWADDMRWMSNHKKRNDKSKRKRIQVNHNITPLLHMSKTVTRIPLELIAICGLIVDVVPCFISDTVVDVSWRRGVAVMSQGDMRHKVRLGGGHAIGMMGVMRGSSVRGRGRLPRGGTMLEWTTSLDMAR